MKMLDLLDKMGKVVGALSVSGVLHPIGLKEDAKYQAGAVGTLCKFLQMLKVFVHLYFI